jgi:hypothetical protein
MIQAIAVGFTLRDRSFGSLNVRDRNRTEKMRLSYPNIWNAIVCLWFTNAIAYSMRLQTQLECDLS